MMVTGFKKAILSVIFGNMKYKKWEVEKDEKFIETLLKTETLFWYHVENKIVHRENMEFKDGLLKLEVPPRPEAEPFKIGIK